MEFLCLYIYNNIPYSHIIDLILEYIGPGGHGDMSVCPLLTHNM